MRQDFNRNMRINLYFVPKLPLNTQYDFFSFNIQQYLNQNKFWKFNKNKAYFETNKIFFKIIYLERLKINCSKLRNNKINIDQKEQKIENYQVKYLSMLRKNNQRQTKIYLKDLLEMPEASNSVSISDENQNNWMLERSQKTSYPTTIIYDDFIYTDKLTKNKIRMRDAKTSYEKGRHYRSGTALQLVNFSNNNKQKKRQSRITKQNSSDDLQKQLTDLNECFLMLKSTQMFKMNSLRQKIFKSSEKQQNEINRNPLKSPTMNGKIQKDLMDLYLKKKKIRNILEDSVKEANLQQFRKFFNDQNHKINPKIVKMNRKIPRSFNKSNIEKIICTMKETERDQNSNHKLVKKIEEDIEFPGQEKLKSDLLGYMKKQIRQNGQYLIVPQKKKLLFQKLHNNVCPKNLNSKPQNLTKINLNSTNNSCDASTMGSRVVISIPSENSFHQNQGTQSKKQSKPKNKKSEKFQAFKKQSNKVKQNQKLEQNFNDQESQNKQNQKGSPLGQFLRQFCFSPSSKNSEISKVKTKLENNHKLESKRLSMKQQRFLFMVESGLLFDVQKQILMNEQYLFLKDKNEDNLLHLCAKNHSTEMFLFIIERLRKCEGRREMVQKWGKELLRNRLLQLNKNNKTVFDVARVYHSEQIVERLMSLKVQLNISDQEL